MYSLVRNKKNVMANLVAFIFSFVLILSITSIKTDAANITTNYTSKVETRNWATNVKNGELSGTVGQALRLEGLKISTEGLPSGGYIEYQAHVQNIGWMSYVQEGENCGPSGGNLRIEALKIRLKNVPSNYHVRYQVHVQNIGWMEWAFDDQMAGTTGRALRIEAIRIQVYSDDFGVSVSGHIQNVGWTKDVTCTQDNIIGVPQEEYRLEALRFNLNSTDPSVNIKSQAYVKGQGWLNYGYNGQVVGTEGKALPIQGLKINLIGVPDYGIEYQAYFKNNGWSNWKANGEIVGVPGNGDIMTGIRIRTYLRNSKPSYPANPVIEKPKPSSSYKRVALDIGHNVVYDGGAIGIRRENDTNMEVGIRTINNLISKGYYVVQTKPSTATSTMDSLIQRYTLANNSNVSHFASIHFNKGGASGTEVYYNKDRSKPLATSILNKIVALGYNNRGIRFAEFQVITHTTMPSVLIECSYLDSSEDMNKYNPDALADAIANGIDEIAR